MKISITPKQEATFASLSRTSKDKVLLIYEIAIIQDRIGFKPMSHTEFDKLYDKEVSQLASIRLSWAEYLQNMGE